MSQSDAVNPEDMQQLERRARRFWVSVIVGFLGLQVLIGVASVVLALNDPSVAVIPNYHQSALDWDVTHRARNVQKNSVGKLITTWFLRSKWTSFAVRNDFGP